MRQGYVFVLTHTVVRSVVRSTYLHREDDTGAGQLACHPEYQGMLP